MDISSDLTELGKTPVTVISAGVKSILDIPRTLEYLVLLVSSAFSNLYSKHNFLKLVFDAILCICTGINQGITILICSFYAQLHNN